MVVGIAAAVDQVGVVAGVERSDEVDRARRQALVAGSHPAPPDRDRILHGLGGERDVGDVVVATLVAELARLLEHARWMKSIDSHERWFISAGSRPNVTNSSYCVIRDRRRGRTARRTGCR